MKIKINKNKKKEQKRKEKKRKKKNDEGNWRYPFSWKTLFMHIIWLTTEKKYTRTHGNTSTS